MNSISSYLERLKAFVMSATGRLAASYLIVIMGMSLGYSVVLYSTSSSELGRQLPPPSLFEDNPNSSEYHLSQPRVNDFLNQRIAEGEKALLRRLILLNIVTLLIGAGLSYYLARRTLKPIEDSMEAQSQFVSDASHELRTPLTTIQTGSEVALRNPNLTLAESKDLLQQNIEDVAKLQSLTDSLLTLATQDAGNLPTEPVSLQEIVNEAMNRVVSQAQAKSIAVDDATPPIKVLANRQSLVQAVVVLLDNAIKYSPKGSTIRILGAKKGKQAILKVRDVGPGIRPYDTRRIFDRFYRADQSRSTQHVSGHGIGLSLAKKIVEQQGGEIYVTSAVGKGSVFSIVLPLA
jgi:two-component system sensor histidine kinase CiaH